MGKMVSTWQDIIKGNNAWIFSGVPNATDALSGLVAKGHLLQQGKVPTSQVVNQTIQGSVESAVYAYLIPQAWSYSNEGIAPFILDSGFPCSAVNPLPTYMTNADGDATYYCNPGNNQLYYLMVVSTGGGNSAQTCTQTPCGGTETCKPNKFSQPPGISHLDGSSYGGVTYQDFIIG
jgi:hypothetical protein